MGVILVLMFVMFLGCFITLYVFCVGVLLFFFVFVGF